MVYLDFLFSTGNSNILKTPNLLVCGMITLHCGESFYLRYLLHGSTYRVCLQTWDPPEFHGSLCDEGTDRMEHIVHDSFYYYFFFLGDFIVIAHNIFIREWALHALHFFMTIYIPLCKIT